MDEIRADYNEAELELLNGFLQKVTAVGVIAAHPQQQFTATTTAAMAAERLLEIWRQVSVGRGHTLA
jgi:hypothetical protein